MHEIVKEGLAIFGMSDLRMELHAKKLLICAGDEQNDISMLDMADFGFCPAGSAVADRYPNVCSCNEGAVADVIYKKIPAILERMP